MLRLALSKGALDRFFGVGPGALVALEIGPVGLVLAVGLRL